MTYRELREVLQDHMCRQGYVEGSLSMQESMARQICYKMFESLSSPYRERLSFKEISGGEVFYDIYASAPGGKVRIGDLRSDGALMRQPMTLMRQPIKVYFRALDAYGDVDANLAILYLAREGYRREKDRIEVAKAETEKKLKSIEEKECKNDAVLNEIERRIREKN